MNPVNLPEILLNTLPAAIYAKDRDGRYTFANDHAAELLGLAREDIIGKTDFDLLGGSEAATLRWADQQAMDAGPQEIETRVGGRIIHDLRVPVPGPDGDPAGVVGLSVDVTERKSVEREMHDTRRMDALGRMARGIVHDFNHVMGIIRGHSNFIRNDTAPATPDQAERRGYGRLKEDLDAIDSALNEGEKLVDDLMSFARGGNHKITEECLSAVVRDMEGLLHFPKVRVVLNLTEDHGMILANHSQLRQVVMNLILNARDAMPEGGVLTVSTFVTKTHVGLSVADTGDGMDMRENGEIFEPFFTTKPKGQGTGLGLATVYGIVQETNGDIRVQSTVGEGTGVIVTFPLHHR